MHGLFAGRSQGDPKVEPLFPQGRGRPCPRSPLDELLLPPNRVVLPRAVSVGKLMWDTVYPDQAPTIAALQFLLKAFFAVVGGAFELCD